MFKDSQKIIYLKTRYIYVPSFSARKSFDESALAALSKSIKQMGIINPLCVRETGGGRYTLISGERRLIAAKTAGLKTVPCLVKNISGVEAKIFSLSENLHRSDLDFSEYKAALKEISEKSGLDNFSLAARLCVDPACFVNEIPKEPPKKESSARQIKGAVCDPKLFENSLLRIVTAAQNAGFCADIKSRDGGDFTEYKLKLSKSPAAYPLPL